ncbi:MAG: hypothetical protein ABI658_26265 [Acidimicrobiales bacterium]
MAQHTRYSGETVEIFGWTPSGQPIPCLRSHDLGENAGDQAFVDERAMYWDGDAWQPLLWKDFAVWTKADASPKRRASDVQDVQVELDFPVDFRDEIDVRIPAE